MAPQLVGLDNCHLIGIRIDVRGQRHFLPLLNVGFGLIAASSFLLRAEKQHLSWFRF